MLPEVANRSPARTVALVVGLGVAQLLAWGALYYAIAVVGTPMAVDLGLSEGQVFGAFTWALVLSGLLAPWSGRLLDRFGGRAVLASSGLVGALGFAWLGRTESFASLLIAWTLNGLAIALGLYDTCFAALAQVEPARYRRTVTGVTLVAGFASTVSWPVSHFLMRHMGWRSLCDLYAGALILCALMYFAVLPQTTNLSAPRTISEQLPLDVTTRRRARWLALAFAGAALISGAMSAHLLSVLRALSLPDQTAIWAASSMGAMQVLGRVLELTLGAKLGATRVGLVTFVALTASLPFLLLVRVSPAFVWAFALVYGVANGLLTIAKATLPIEMFGLKRAGAVLGDFGAPSLVTRAIAPLAFALSSQALGTTGSVLGATVICAASTFAYVFGSRWSSPARTVSRRI